MEWIKGSITCRDGLLAGHRKLQSLYHDQRVRFMPRFFTVACYTFLWRIATKHAAAISSSKSSPARWTKHSEKHKKVVHPGQHRFKSGAITRQRTLLSLSCYDVNYIEALLKKRRFAEWKVTQHCLLFSKQCLHRLFKQPAFFE